MSTEVMMLDDLITRLQDIRKAEGNIPVTRDNWQDHDMPEPVGRAVVTEVKEHYDAYVVTHSLDAGGFGGRPKFYEPYQTEIEGRPDLKVVFLT